MLVSGKIRVLSKSLLIYHNQYFQNNRKKGNSFWGDGQVMLYVFDQYFTAGQACLGQCGYQQCSAAPPPRIQSLKGNLIDISPSAEPRTVSPVLWWFFWSQQIRAKEYGAYKTNLVMFKTLPALRKQQIFVVSREALVGSQRQLALEYSMIYDTEL